MYYKYFSGPTSGKYFDSKERVYSVEEWPDRTLQQDAGKAETHS